MVESFALLDSGIPTLADLVVALGLDLPLYA